MAEGSDGTAPVVIVGAGPTGLAAAALLDRYGVQSLVLDRWAEMYPQPRAVHLDDEVYRILAQIGIGADFAGISRPMRGLRLVDRDEQPLAQFPRPPLGRHGFPQANMFDQPDLEALLRADVAARPGVELRTATEVVGLTQGPDGALVKTVSLPTGERSSIRAGYVLGCDGANSSVRPAIGARHRHLGFEQRWLVVDIATGADLDTWDGVHQICDAERPATFMRVGGRRYRWEFRLRDGETAAQFGDLESLLPLLRPGLENVPVRALELLRVADYTFRAAVADRWRRDRVLLAGDAAHLLPPFTGQGMGAGLRDVHNLAWKLAGVVHGALPETVLDTYQREREPHVRSLIRIAKIVGSAMSAGGRSGDALRRAIVPRLHLVPGLRARAASSTTPRLGRSDLVARSFPAVGPAGGLCPNVVLPDGTRFDDAAAGRFALVTSLPLTEAQRRAAVERDLFVLFAEPGSELRDWLARHRVRAALVRPDFAVLAAGRRPEPLLARLLRVQGPVRTSIDGGVPGLVPKQSV